MLSSPIKRLLEQRCKDLCDKLRVAQVYVASVLGRRRHYVAGYGQPEPSQPEKMAISPHLVVFWHGNLTEQARESLKTDLQRLTGFLEKEIAGRNSLPSEKEKTKMHTFQTKTVWQHGRECRVSARGNPDLIVATPPEIGGPEGMWSPEELLVASVESCLLSTFLYFADRFNIAFESYSSTSTGTMEKTAQGLRFTGIDVSIALIISDGDVAKNASALGLKEKLEKYCPVSTSLNCPVRLVLEVTQRIEQQGKGPSC